MRRRPADARERLVVALDTDSASDARSIVEELEGAAVHFKVGYRTLYAKGGRDLIEDLVANEKHVLLDAKLHDIPATVAAAATQAAEMGVEMITAHATDGSAAAVARAVADAGHSLAVLAVTVLTSSTQSDLVRDGVSHTLEETVAMRAVAAIESGCDGVVASAREAAMLRRTLGDEVLIATPGIRREGDPEGDQARADTPSAAIASGADYLIVGRPIITAVDKRIAAEQFVDAIRSSSPLRGMPPRETSGA